MSAKPYLVKSRLLLTAAASAAECVPGRERSTRDRARRSIRLRGLLIVDDNRQVAVAPGWRLTAFPVETRNA